PAPGRPSALQKTSSLDRQACISLQLLSSQMSRTLQNPSRTAIGIDVGTSAVKVIAVAEDGEVLERREVSYPLSTPKPGWSEQNPDDWWAATEEALDGLTEGVAGIGLSGQMHGLVTLDSSDRPIRPAILWNDQRTGEECAEIEERVGFHRMGHVLCKH